MVIMPKFRQIKTIMVVLSFVIIAALAFTQNASAQISSLQGKVIKVQSAGLLTFKQGPNTIDAAIYGIEAPSISPAEGKAAMKRLQQLTSSTRPLTFQVRSLDSYGRFVVTITDGDSDIAMTLISEGHVRYDASKCKLGFCRAYKTAEDQAKQNNLGLWQKTPR